MPTKPIERAVVLGAVAPTLAELESRPCSLEELQATIVQLVRTVNENAQTTSAIGNALNRKQDRLWRASL